MGPMSGRAAGYCAGYPVPGFMNPLPGRGWGYGRGRGRGRGWGRGWGWGRWYGAPGPADWSGYEWPQYYGPGPAVAPPSPTEETQSLKAQAQYFESALENIRKRIEELEAAKEKED